MEAGETSRTTMQRFAADLIGLDERAKSADTLTGLLHKLRDHDFLPDPVSHEAILALSGRPIGHGSLLVQEAVEFQERRLNAEIEQFASEYFAIPVDVRSERWKGLVESCSRKSRLIGRLRDLKPGLAIDPARTVDPSPIVKDLIDDILALFPMKPARRAAESRVRAQRLLADTKGKQADRSKALKQLRKRHPELIAISNGYLDRFTTPDRPQRQSGLTERVVAAKLRTAAGDSSNIRAFVTIAVVLFAAFSRFLTANSAQRPQPSPPSFPVVPQPSFSSHPRPLAASAPNKIVRDELKTKLRQELDKLDRFLDEPKLDRVVAGLPVEVVPNLGGMGNVRLLGAWTDKIQASFVKALREGLMDADLGLTDQEVDDVVARCLPHPAPGAPSPRPIAP